MKIVLEFYIDNTNKKSVITFLIVLLNVNNIIITLKYFIYFIYDIKSSTYFFNMGDINIYFTDLGTY